jgi:hypothetical protein
MASRFNLKSLANIPMSGGYLKGVIGLAGLAGLTVLGYNSFYSGMTHHLISSLSVVVRVVVVVIVVVIVVLITNNLLAMFSTIGSTRHQVQPICRSS